MEVIRCRRRSTQSSPRIEPLRPRLDVERSTSRRALGREVGVETRPSGRSIASSRPSGRLSLAALRNVLDVLHAGGTIVFPTETSYGLGCDALDPSALRRVYALKGRPGTKALPVIVASRGMAQRYVRFPRTAQPLINRFWPGPLTLVLPVRRALPSALTGGRRSLAVRMSSHPIAQQIVRAYGRPVVATSANRSGSPSLYTVRTLRRHFRDGLPDLVIDAGALPRRPASTIIACSGRRLRFIRAGAVPFTAVRP